MRAEAINKRPVHAGLIGGAYKPLQQGDLEKIHHTALEVLETIGIGSPTAEVTELATAAGCWIDDNERLCFPQALIEDTIASAAREYIIYSRSPDHADLEVGGYHVNYSTSGEAVSIYQPGERATKSETGSVDALSRSSRCTNRCGDPREVPNPAGSRGYVPRQWPLVNPIQA
jgi:trimethylamine--corrinoid protein Co-methyltransferase